MTQRENCAVLNKKLFGPMVRQISLSKTLSGTICHDITNKQVMYIYRTTVMDTNGRKDAIINEVQE